MVAFSSLANRHGGALALVFGAGFIAWRNRVLTAAKERKRQRIADEQRENDLSSEGNDKKRAEEKVQRAAVVNAAFFKKLKALLKIAIPGWRTQEAGYLATLAAFLVVRTFLSIKISEVNGSIVKAIVERNWSMFLQRLAVLASIAIPASTVNSMLKFLNSKMALAFRQRLTKHFHGLYLQPRIAYHVLNLDSRIANPDQALTETMERWGKSFAEIYSNVTKPLLDIVLFSLRLSELVGPQGPASVILYYAFCAVIIRLISPKFGKMTATQQQLEGKFRHGHNRLMTHSEEVSFYAGHRRERIILDAKFNAVVKHANTIYLSRLGMGIFDGFLVKYGAVMLGYAVLGMPVFGKGSEEYIKRIGEDKSMIVNDYIRNSSLLINLAGAIGRIVVSYKDMQKLAGYTSLVSEMQDVLVDLQTGKYKRSMVEKVKAVEESKDGSSPTNAAATASTELVLRAELAPRAGTVINDCNEVAFEDVPIVTPNGDLLVDHVSFQVKQHQNLMIVGPNGCGKSSLFRILGALWPVWGGVVKKPHDGALFYVPQRPYMCVGTLRDQVLYPDTKEDMEKKGWTDDELAKLMALVKLSHLIERKGGWNAERDDWVDRLSGGEKQRLAMARLFYHRPMFAILDECTSQVSVDVEGILYSECRKQNISLITISHRQTLWEYHDLMLMFDGRGSYQFGPMVLPKDHKMTSFALPAKSTTDIGKPQWL